MKSTDDKFNTHDETIEISLSKGKTLLSLTGSLIFVGLGFWFLLNPPITKHPIFGNSTFTWGLGLVTVTFFGLLTMLFLKKLMDKKAGFYINQQGITDNSSGLSAGFVPWENIKTIKIAYNLNQKYIIIAVHNTQDFLETIKNPIKKAIIQINLKIYNSPISISSNILNIKFEDLHKTLNNQMNLYKTNVKIKN